MRRLALILALLVANIASAKTPIPAEMGIDPSAEPEIVQVLNGSGFWTSLGQISGGLFTPYCGTIPCTSGGGGGGGATPTLIANGASGLNTQFTTTAGVAANASALSTTVPHDYIAGHYFMLPYAGDSTTGLTPPTVTATFVNGPSFYAVKSWAAGDTTLTVDGSPPVQTTPPGANTYLIDAAQLYDDTAGCTVGTISGAAAAGSATGWAATGVITLTAGASCPSLTSNDLLSLQQPGYGQMTSAVGIMSGGVIPVTSGPPTQVTGFPAGSVVNVHDMGTVGAPADNVIGALASWSVAGTVHGTINSPTTADTVNCPGDTGGRCLHVTSVVSGAITLGAYLSDTNTIINGGTFVQSMLSATGGVGYYLLNQEGTDPGDYPNGYQNPASITVGGQITVTSPVGSVASGDRIALTTSLQYAANAIDSAHFPDAKGAWSCCGVSTPTAASNLLANVPAILGPQQFVSLAITPGNTGASGTATFSAGDQTLTLSGGACPARIAFNQAIYDATAGGPAYVGRVYSCVAGLLTLQDAAKIGSGGAAHTLVFRLPTALYKSVGGAVPYWLNSAWIDWIDGFSSTYMDTGYCRGGTCPAGTGSRPPFLNACATGPGMAACPAGNTNVNDWAIRHVDSVSGGVTINFSPQTVNTSNGARAIYHDDAPAFDATIGTGNVQFDVPPGNYLLDHAISALGKAEVGIDCAEGAVFYPFGTGDIFDYMGQPGALVAGGTVHRCRGNGQYQAVGWAGQFQYVNKDFSLEKLTVDGGYNGIVYNQFTNLSESDITLTNLGGEPLKGHVSAGSSSAFGQIDGRHIYVGGQSGQKWGNRAVDGVGYDNVGGVATTIIANAQAERISGASLRTVGNPLGVNFTGFTAEFQTGNPLLLLGGQKMQFPQATIRTAGTDNFISCPLSANVLDAIDASTNFVNLNGGRNETASGDGIFANGARLNSAGVPLYRNSAINRTQSENGMIGPGGTKGVCSGVRYGANSKVNKVTASIVGLTTVFPTYQLYPAVFDPGAQNNSFTNNDLTSNINNYAIDNSGNLTNTISCNPGSTIADCGVGAGPAIPAMSGTCAASGQMGAQSDFRLTTASPCGGGSTLIFTFAQAARHFWTCRATDATTPGDTWVQTAQSPTAVTMTGSSAAADAIEASCKAY